MTEKKPLRPTHRLKILDRDGGAKSQIGAGWLNADGSLTIKLEPGTALTYEDSKGYSIHLFPIDRGASSG